MKERISPDENAVHTQTQSSENEQNTNSNSASESMKERIVNPGDYISQMMKMKTENNEFYEEKEKEQENEKNTESQNNNSEKNSYQNSSSEPTVTTEKKIETEQVKKWESSPEFYAKLSGKTVDMSRKFMAQIISGDFTEDVIKKYRLEGDEKNDLYELMQIIFEERQASGKKEPSTLFAIVLFIASFYGPMIYEQAPKRFKKKKLGTLPPADRPDPEEKTKQKEEQKHKNEIEELKNSINQYKEMTQSLIEQNEDLKHKNHDLEQKKLRGQRGPDKSPRKVASKKTAAKKVPVKKSPKKTSKNGTKKR